MRPSALGLLEDLCFGTTLWWSARALPACALQSRPSAPAPTSRSSRSCTRRAPTRARPRAASTPRSATPPRTAPRSTRSTPSRASDYLGDQDAIEIMCTEAPGDIYELEHMGAIFSRFADGRIAQRPFGAAGSPRTVYSADITGHVLIHVLYEQLLKYEVPVYEEFFALDLAIDDGRCVGVLAWDIVRGGVHGISAHNTILATGGMGRMYYGTTNAYACTGDGMSMAWRAGVPLKDMEFMQFHPTTLKSNGVLITEGCRGEGGVPAQRERRALHGDRGAERDGARLARRRLARRVEGDRGGPRRRRLRAARPHAPRRQEDPHAPARLARARDGLRGRRSDPRADPGPARRPLPHGRRRHGRATARRSCPGCTPPASARASRCTARTASAATR